jgi:hypothetical protein
MKYGRSPVARSLRGESGADPVEAADLAERYDELYRTSDTLDRRSDGLPNGCKIGVRLILVDVTCITSKTKGGIVTTGGSDGCDFFRCFYAAF